MARYAGLILVLLLVLPPGLPGQTSDSATAQRHYELLAGPIDELEPFAAAGVALNGALTDLFDRAIRPRLSPGVAPWIETAWAIHWSFVCTMWPHDGGHWARAQQVGGDFVVTRFGYPFPTAEMRLPATLERQDRTLTSIGGHEINFLMRRRIHSAYYERRSVLADELIHAFIQDVFYPFYAFVIAYADPTTPSTWTDTRGDPVEHTLSVFQTFTGRDPIRPDGVPDPDLVDRYQEATYVSLLWPLLSPMFYQGLGAFSVDRSHNRGALTTPWMLDLGPVEWSWGTHFHPSPLGYELHLENYLRAGERLAVVTLRAGRPERNIGIGLAVPSVLESGALRLGLTLDAWDQALFGAGGSVLLDGRYEPSGRLGALLRAGWKSRGYLVGRRVDPSPIVLAGLTYRF